MPKRGGKAIGVGSDGCVFDGTFAPDGTFTKSSGGERVVTKVLMDKTMADQEYAMMERVDIATGGEGVLVGTTEPIKVSSVPDGAWEGDAIKARGGCNKIAGSAGPFYAIQMPRVDGTVSDLRGTPMSNINTVALQSGLSRLIRVGKLVHMDMAARNIFYKTQGSKYQLLLGDFGSSISLESDEFDDAIRGFINKYKLAGNFLACIKTDGIYPGALAMMIGYHALREGKDAFDTFVKDIRNLADETETLAEQTWICVALSSRTVNSDDFKTLKDRIALQYGQIIGLFAGDGKDYDKIKDEIGAIKSKLQSLLSNSDACMFEAVKGLLSADAVDIKPILAKWFTVRGAKRRMGGAESVSNRVTRETNFDIAEDAFRVEDPKLKKTERTAPIVATTPDQIIGPADPPKTGARRKTRRNRRYRGKMSRKN